MAQPSANVNLLNPVVVTRYPLQVLAIQSSADMEVLRKPRAALRRSRVLVRIPGLPIEKSVKWELELNAKIRECGCSLGAHFVFLGLVASAIWQFIFLSWDISQCPWFFVRAIVTMIVSGAVGKSLGIALAKARILRIAYQIREFENKYSAKGLDHVDMHKVG